MRKTRKAEHSDELDLKIPEFETRAEFDAWYESLPKVHIEVDPRLREKDDVSLRLSRMVIDGFNYLAEQRGLRSGQELMRIVLGNYVAKSLPPDF